MDCYEDDVPHVLAVDDNLVDRKLVERLLKSSSCRGKKKIHILGIFFVLFRSYLNHTTYLYILLLLCDSDYSRKWDESIGVFGVKR